MVLIAGKKDKRGLVALSDGSIVDEALLSPDPVAASEREEEIMLQQSLLHGLAGYVGNLPVQNLQKETVSIPIYFFIMCYIKLRFIGFRFVTFTSFKRPSRFRKKTF